MTEVTTMTPASGAGTGLSDQLFVGELCEALEQGLEVEWYLRGRSGGITHNELLGIGHELMPMGPYIEARLSGATPSEIRVHADGENGRA
jgi:hypothetical protein